MARKLNPGQIINGYTIEELLNTGAMALAYSARAKDGRKVFLKQYKSPSVRVPWYNDYVKYQDAIKTMVEKECIRHMTVEFTETFEAKAGPLTYFQVFEFVDGAENLSQILEKIRTSPSSITWGQKEIFAKVIMASVSALHQVGIVHCDLKPANLQLFRDREIRAGYRLKLIDMDFSILADCQAPWHDSDQGYVGTPGYFSPEHLQGPKPLIKSDVFTCGLILYELLSKKGHPYPYDVERYKEAVLANEAPNIKLLGALSGTADKAEVADIIRQCLHPDPNKRPSANDVLNALNGIGRKKKAKEPRTATPKEAPEKDISPSPTCPVGDSSSNRLRLIPGEGDTLSFNISTDIGRHLCQGMGNDSQFMATIQFTLKSVGNGNWSIIPASGTTNQTMHNGKAITEETDINDGDVVAVGRQDKGIEKLPMTIKIGD